MKQPKKKKRKIKLSAKLVIGLVIFALINLIFLSVVIGFYYFSVEILEARENAFSLVRSGAHMVDGDRIEAYLDVVGADENGDPIYYTDEYYTQVMHYLDAIQSENELVMYYYIGIPDEKGMIFLWDADSAENASPQGYWEAYYPKEKKAVDLAFQREPTEEIVVITDEHWGNLMSAFYPIFDSSGEPVALIGIDLSLDDVLNQFLVYLSLILITILLVTVLSILILYRFARKHMIKPIQKINQAAKDIVGELRDSRRFDLEIHTGDEMEELADSFRKMDADLHEYLGQLTAVTADRERIHAELHIAKQIQADILPNVFPAFPERNDFDICAALAPGSEIGGDYYDFFLIDNDHLAMLMGDVAGEGVPAALYMVIVETLIKSRAVQGFTPAEVLQSVSEQLLSYNMDMFSFLWFAVLELSTGRGIAVNAGHEHPILHRAGKPFELQRYHHSPPVGAIEDIRYRDHGFQLRPGDSLFIFSDGVKSASNEKAEPFGIPRILEALNREPEATPSVQLQTVRQAITRFTGEKQQIDDLTMLCLKYYGPSQPRHTRN